MNITEVRVFPVREEKLKAFVSIVIDDVFVVSDIKIIDGKNGRFLSMPATRRKNGTFRDIAHPLNVETRRLIEDRVFERYDQVLAGSVEASELDLIERLAGAPLASPQADAAAPAQRPFRHAAL